MSASSNADDALVPGDSAPDLALADDQGQNVRLADLWAKRPLMLLFVRHFG